MFIIIVIEGYTQHCCHSGIMCLALFFNHLKKTGKYIELCFLFIMKSVITFAVGSKFYQWGLKGPTPLSTYLKNLSFSCHSKRN